MTSYQSWSLVKKILGVVWVLLGPVVLFYLVRTAAAEIGKKPSLDTWVQWGVFIIVFIPIAMGLVLFGYYSIKGEYDEV